MKQSRSGARNRLGERSRVAVNIFRCFAFCLLLTGSIVAVHWVLEARHAAAPDDDAFSEPAFSEFSGFQPGQVQSRNSRLVYPYSIVPGGVASADELRAAAVHDPVVATHYAGFDYQRARVVEVKHPQLVYLSYRRGNHVFWTTKQASLHVGEKLLTDGRITARTRCGNQVSVLPQASTGRQEPTMAELDRPDAVASGMEQTVPLNSDLLNVDPILSAGPASPGSFGPPPGIFVPMPIGGGSPGVPGNGCPSNQNGSTSNKNCGTQTPPPPPPPVPEPGTIVLVSSGAAAILSRFRSARKRS